MKIIIKLLRKIDTKTYNKITGTLKNYALAQFIDLSLDYGNLTSEKIKDYYKTLK